jgi:hypothetical protein
VLKRRYRGKQLKKRKNEGSGTSLTYYVASNLAKVHDTVADNSMISSFGYVNTFVNDTVGNRLVLNSSGTRTTTVSDNVNQIKCPTAAARRAIYTFDANGNQQLVREHSGVRTTTNWNYENEPMLSRMKPRVTSKFCVQEEFFRRRFRYEL